MAFRCKDKRAWTTKCNKTCVTGSGDVPRLVHFIQIGDSMRFMHWLAVMSAIQFIRPDLVMVHYLGGRTTCWSRRIRAHPLVVFKELTADLIPTRVNGVVISKPAHRSDFLRMNLLWQYGGVYMDSDAIITKSFHPLMRWEAVVSYQVGKYVGSGLIVSRSRSCFICSFARHACNNFNGGWITHSVWALTQMVMTERHLFPRIKVLKYPEGFFPFSYTPSFLDQLFKKPAKQVRFNTSQVYTLHLYNKISSSHTKAITYDWIQNQSSPVALALQHILPFIF